MSIIGGVGASQTVGPASGGKVTPINNLGTSPTQIIGGNPSRVSITFHAPGAIDIYVAPLVTATGATLIPSLGSLGGTFHIFAGASLTIGGECQTGWQAFAASSSNQPLTVSESNV